MKRKHSNPIDSVHERLFVRGHLTEEAILQGLDGELTAKEASEIDSHLQACWSCRSRRQAIAQGIADFVEYQHVVTAPYLPPPSDQRDIFLARLHEVAMEMERPSRLRNGINRTFRILTLSQLNQIARIAAVLFLISSAFLIYFLHYSNDVTGDQLLTLTAASEAKSLKGAADPVVVQKLRISSGQRTVTRTIYHAVGRNRLASRIESAATADKQVDAAYLKTSLDWNAPLSAETFHRWRATRPARTDKVIRLGNDQLTLRTTPSAGEVIEADLTVRIADYHAIKESFRFQDDTEVEIAELSYDVIPFASLPLDIFGAPVHVALPRLPALPVLRSALPGKQEVAEAEIQAEVLLHGLGADLGEQINIAAQAGRGVSIDGVVVDDARKQQLLAVLRTIPHTQTHILTVEEAAQQPSATPVSSPATPAASSMQVMVAAPALLDAELKAHFPDKDQRSAYVNQTLSLAQLASARAWALNRLADRHPPQLVAALGVDGRHKLQVLLTDHVSALREDIGSLQNEVAEILPRSSNTPAANTSVKEPPEARSATPETTEDWRDRIHRIHSATEAIHESIAALLSSSQPSDRKDADAIEVNLRTTLTQVQTELQTLDQKVQETDLK